MQALSMNASATSVYLTRSHTVVELMQWAEVEGDEERDELDEAIWTSECFGRRRFRPGERKMAGLGEDNGRARCH